jgi:hypothetical protein
MIGKIFIFIIGFLVGTLFGWVILDWILDILMARFGM